MSAIPSIFLEAGLPLYSILSIKPGSLSESVIVIIGWEGLGQFRKMMGA